MAAFKHLPELNCVNGKWVFDQFTPAQAAFDWNKMRDKLGTLYILVCADHVKIGITQNFQKRFSDLGKANPLPVRRVRTRNVPLAGLAYAEAWMHHQLAEHRIKGEWFLIDTKTAIDLLPKAVRRAEVYADYCRDWYRADKEKWREIDARTYAKAQKAFAVADDYRLAAMEGESIPTS